jgi:hypothetical protein
MSFREGTRAYGVPQRVSVSSSSAQSSALTEVDEVLLHATTACYVLAGSNPTVTTSTGLPLIAGEKFHMRVSPGSKIAVIRDSADGFLFIVPTRSS